MNETPHINRLHASTHWTTDGCDLEATYGVRLDSRWFELQLEMPSLRHRPRPAAHRRVGIRRPRTGIGCRRRESGAGCQIFSAAGGSVAGRPS
jgi:hypothetical protein